MSKEPAALTEIEIARRDWMAEHLRSYLQSGGAKGHIVDLRPIGGLAFTTHLLLKTVGRKSGNVRIAPLIYGDIGGEVVIVASKGGADVHPAWYLNIKSAREVDYQIGGQAFRSTWREPQGKERGEIWDFMAKNYPPYTQYQTQTKRIIPLVMFSSGTPIEIFRA
jgi:deazaflavin-dependent oxidoreductase (nitroreductase family)